MHKILADLLAGFNLSGDIKTDAIGLLVFCGYADVADHTIKVANEAKRIARRFSVSERSAYIAALLHDVGNVFEKDKRVELCTMLNVEVLDEERRVPSLLHSKISRIIATEVFNISDKDILSAIECHTTLKAEAGQLDMILFTADKLSWDNQDNTLFINNIVDGLEKSLEHAAFAYLDYLYQHKEAVNVFHPWTLNAYNDLKYKLLGKGV